MAGVAARYAATLHTHLAYMSNASSASSEVARRTRSAALYDGVSVSGCRVWKALLSMVSGKHSSRVWLVVKRLLVVASILLRCERSFRR